MRELIQLVKEDIRYVKVTDSQDPIMLATHFKYELQR